MKDKIISLFLTLIATSAFSSTLNRPLELKIQHNLKIMFETQLKFLEEKRDEKFSELENKWSEVPWLPNTGGFKCGFVRQNYYQLPQKYYVFHNPADIEFWVPINGKSTSRTFWQVTASM
jgi:hypothetical protein